jgi:hypothetical protein
MATNQAEHAITAIQSAKNPQEQVAATTRCPVMIIEKFTCHDPKWGRQHEMIEGGQRPRLEPEVAERKGRKPFSAHALALSRPHGYKAALPLLIATMPPIQC